VNNVREVDAILALDTRAFDAGRDPRIVVTCAMVIPLTALVRAGLGSERLAAVRLEGRKIVATLERVYANQVLATREAVPQGELAQTALVQLLVRGSVFRDAVNTTRQRLIHAAIAAWRAARGHPAGVSSAEPVPGIEAWLAARVASLGVQTGEDLALLSPSDFLAPELPYESRGSIEQDYPLLVSVGDASYRADYDLSLNQVTLHMLKGSRTEAPALGYLPKFPGLRLLVEGPRGLTVLRARG
jgi:ATP-dependent helicase HrpB